MTERNEFKEGNEWISRAASAVLYDLDDRSLGIDSLDMETREEIVKAIEAEIRKASASFLSDTVKERDTMREALIAAQRALYESGPVGRNSALYQKITAAIAEGNEGAAASIEVLPCKVSCDGGPSFGKGVKLATLLGYFMRRKLYNEGGVPDDERGNEGTGNA